MKQPDRKDINRRLQKRLFKVFIALPLCLLTLWIFGGNFVAWCMEIHEDREWGKVSIPMNEIPVRFPEKNKNEAAIEIEKQASGIEVSFRRSNKPKPTDANGNPIKNIHDLINEYLKQQLSKSDSEIDPLPEEISRYLSNHRDGIDKLQQFINRNDPDWGVVSLPHIVDDCMAAEYNSLATSVGNVLCNEGHDELLGWIRLQKVLALICLDHLYRNEEQAAVEDFRAIKKMIDSENSNPDLVMRLMQLAAGNFYAGLARKFKSSTVDLRAPNRAEWIHHLMIAIEQDLWKDREVIRKNPGNGRWTENLLKTTFVVLMRPATRIMFTQYSKKMRETVSALDHTGWDPCQYDPSDLIKQTDDIFPKWNLVGRILSFQPFTSLRRLDRFVLEMELSSQIQELVSARVNESNGAWPPSDSPLNSKVCKGERWIYEVSPDRRTMRIHFSKKMDWPGQKGLILPMEYSETIEGVGK